MNNHLKLLAIAFFTVFLCVPINVSKAVDAAAECKTWYAVGTAEYNNCLKQYDSSTATPPSQGAGGGGGNTTIEFKNPIGASTVMQVLTNLLTNLKGVVIIVAVIFIIIGGLMYMLSGGNEKTITRAKACIGGAIIGLAIVLAAPIFLGEILKIFGGATDIPTNGQTSTMTLADVATRVLNLLLSILGIVAIISLVIGGGMYLTAYGDEKKIETAKKIVTYAIIGIVISLSSVIIVSQIGDLLGGGVGGSGTTPTIPTTPTTPTVPTPPTNTGFPRGYQAI